MPKTGSIKAVYRANLPKSGEVKIPLDLLKEFLAESQPLHIKWGPGWIGIVAIEASFFKKLTANPQLSAAMKEANMKAALEG